MRIDHHKEFSLIFHNLHEFQFYSITRIFDQQNLLIQSHVKGFDLKKLK